MDNIATIERAIAPSRNGSRFRLPGMLLGLLTALLWFMLCRHLSGEWSVNEQYSYGWFVPFFALFLFWLRWEDRPGREFRISNFEFRIAATGAVAALLLLLPLRLFEVGNPDWRPLGWMHAAIVVALSLLALWLYGARKWARHFAFPVSFILIAVPWVTPIEGPIVQGLMRIVAIVATETLHLFGIPAQLEGSLIRISTGLVGVNEACSGVRSLQTSLMIGLLFGELKRLSVTRRFLLVGGALAIALLCNFGRAFTLVWLSATRGTATAEHWHDGLGYAIVALVFVGSLTLAALLSDRKSDDTADQSKATGEPAIENRSSSGRHPSIAPFPLRTSWLVACLAWLLTVEIAVEAWYRSQERTLVARDKWTVRYPESAPGFRQIDIDEEVQRTLRYDEGREVRWSLPSQSGRPDASAAFLFFFRWEPGTSTILRARSHRPDICLPNVGWRQTGDFGVRKYPIGGGSSLPFRHFAFVREAPGQRPAYAHSFFCMQEDKVPPADATGRSFDLTEDQRTSDWMVRDRVRVVFEGLRNPGQQVMQLVMIGQSQTGSADAEAEFARLLPEIAAVDTTTRER